MRREAYFEQTFDDSVLIEDLQKGRNLQIIDNTKLYDVTNFRVNYVPSFP
jgi:hypothetical protein